MKEHKKKHGSILLRRFVFLCIAVVFVAFIVLQRQLLVDYVYLLRYDPPERVRQIRDDLMLTKQGEVLFYVHNPQVIKSSDFTKSCPIYEETIVLGCYFSKKSIYIFDIDDNKSELQGIEEVTAAHEILHAAYDRLSQKERKAIVGLLYEVYESLPQDSSIRKSIEAYRRQGEDVVQNELHSIIGTELDVIPVALEDYYARYFHDRRVVVDFSKQYGETFREIQQAIDQYDTQIQELQTSINQLEQKMTQDYADISSTRQTLLQIRESGDIQDYNNKVTRYNKEVASYNTLVETYEDQINKYNNFVEERNMVAIEQRSLYNSIDAKFKKEE